MRNQADGIDRFVPVSRNLLFGFRGGRLLMGEVNAATPDADCARLLREFAASGSEAAFTELVRRQVDLVYSTALRRLGGDAALAKDVAQTVFTDLACRSRRQEALVSGPGDQWQAPGDTVAQSSTPALPASLGGWLHRHTCFVAATVVRGEIRRRAREETAMQLQSQADATDWSRVAPVLDDALDELPARDRDALVLRFLERQPFARVGATLGVSEDAARMRVDRALDKLREFLGKRGVTSTAAALGLALGQHAIASAPAGLAITLTGTALMVAGTTDGAVSFFLFMKSKLALGILGGAVVTTALVWHQHNVVRLTDENEGLRRQVGALPTSTTAMSGAADAEELTRLRGEHSELLRLRGEVTQLRGREGISTESQRSSQAPSATGLESSAQADAEMAHARKVSGQIVNALKYLGLASRIYTADHHSPVLPTRFDDILDQLKGSGMTAEGVFGGGIRLDEFEFFPQPRAITEEEPSLILFREKQYRIMPDGRIVRVYCFADGTVREIGSPNGDFSAFERDGIASADNTPKKP